MRPPYHNDDKPGIIYVIGIDNWRASKLFKIGRTSEGRIETRLGDLQIGNPWRLYVACEFYTNTPVSLEAAIHDELKRYRLRGEWFDFSSTSRDPVLFIKRVIWQFLDVEYELKEMTQEVRAVARTLNGPVCDRENSPTSKRFLCPSCGKEKEASRPMYCDDCRCVRLKGGYAHRNDRRCKSKALKDGLCEYHFSEGAK